MTSFVSRGFPLEEEYKKPTCITPDDIAKLREWLSTQPHLPKDHITDLDLILIYHRYDRSIEVSKQQLDNQFTLRTLFESFFKDRRIDDKIELFLSTTLLTILPERTKEGYTVFYSRLIDPDLNKFNLGTALSFTELSGKCKAMVTSARVPQWPDLGSGCYRSNRIFMVFDLWQYLEGTWPGFVIIFDLIGLKFGLMAKLDMQNIQQFVNYLPDALLLKLKSIHFLNAPSFIDRLSAIMRTFAKKEMLEIIAIYTGSGECLAGVLDVDTLPIEVGGKYKTIEQFRAETCLKMREHESYFLEENKKRVNESLHPGKPKTIADIFGSVKGSFKQLQID